MKIGFIGLGKMGSGCCANLVNKGLDVMVYDLSRIAMETFSGKAVLADSEVQLFSNCDILFLSLPGYPDVEALAGRLLSVGVRRKTVIDLSTSTPMASQRIHAKLKAAGGAFLDAPLTGPPQGARAGTLVVNVGGDEDDFARCEPLICNFAKKVNYIGGPGGGNLVKLMNNFLSLLYPALYAECFPIAEKLGYDVERIYNIIADSSVYCSNYAGNGRKIIDKTFSSAFALDFCIKDLSYFKMLYDELKVPTLMLDAGINLFKMGYVKGYGKDDVSAVAKTVYDNLGLSHQME